MADFQVTKLVRQGSGLYSQTFANAVHQSDASLVTQVAVASNILTVTAANTFTPGAIASFSGLTAAGFLNGASVVVRTATVTDFTAEFTHTDYGPTAETSGYVSSMGGSIVLLGPGGRLDTTVGGGGGGGGASSFDQITSGVNTTASMVVDTGASLSFTGSGVVNANEIIGLSITGGGPTHAGQLLISQPGNTSVAFADPQVQGLYPAGSVLSPAPAYAAPTDIQPVLIGGSDGTNLQNILTNSSGRLQVDVISGGGSNASVNTTGSAVPASATYFGANQSGNLVAPLLDVSGYLEVAVENTVTISGTVAATQSGTWTIDSITNPVAVTGTFWQATQPVSGTVTASVTDGVNIAAVKAASTSPLATDPALVVTLSPNSDQFATSTTANALPGVNPVTVGVSSVPVLATNASRKESIVVNTGTTIIYLGLGQTPTTTSYHIALAKCTVANDGTGGTWVSDMWKGAINAIGSGVGGSVVVTELT